MSRKTVTKDGQTLIVATNGQVRDLLSYHDLTIFEQGDFDYIEPEDRFDQRFARAYGTVIDVNEVPRCVGVLADLGWHGSESWSAWNGVTVKLANNDSGPGAIIGRYTITGM